MENFKELSLNDQKAISGGILPWLIGGYLVAEWIYDNWDDMKEGYMESYNLLKP